MNVNLPQDLSQFLKELVLQGQFESEDAAIAAGVRLLKSREQIRAELASGIRQLDTGDWVDGDEVFAELYATIDAIEAQKQGN